MQETKNKFSVIGIVTNADFQKCKALVERLKISYPTQYESPTIIPMFDLDWNMCFSKLQREVGSKLWFHKKPFVVFLNEEYLGDDEDLRKYLVTKYKFGITKNFQKQGEEQLIEIIKNDMNRNRKYVYMTIAVDNRVVGTMLFMLYNDIVPDTANLFLKRMKSKRHGFKNAPVHRIVKDGWIQCGGNNVKSSPLPCENYIITHNRRGVLSMCNTGRHLENSTQFHVSLVATPWMNYRYVAFGQLVQGDNVLYLLEQVKTNYEKPTQNIRIVKTGEYLDIKEFVPKNGEDLEKYLRKSFENREDNRDLRYLDSEMSVTRYKRGLYFHCGDLRSNLPLLHLPPHILRLYGDEIGAEEEAETETEIETNLHTFGAVVEEATECEEFFSGTELTGDPEHSEVHNPQTASESTGVSAIAAGE